MATVEMISEGAQFNPMVSVHDVLKSYNDELAIDLRGSEGIDVYAGQIVVVTGESGQGKSTLLRFVQGLERPEEGEVLVDGLDFATASTSEIAAKKRALMGIGFQSPNLFEGMPVFANIRNTAILNGSRVSNRRIAELAVAFGIDHKLTAIAEECSGGEMARISAVRALASRPALITLDEPTGGLSAPGKVRAIESLIRVMSPGAAALIVTHDEVLSKYADVEYVIDNHRLMEVIHRNAPARG